MSVLTVWLSYDQRLKATKPGHPVVSGDIISIVNSELTGRLARISNVY